MARLIEKAQENGQIGNRSDPKDLVWASYAIVRGVNVNWCFVLGNCDLIGDSQKALDLLIEPQPLDRLWRDGNQPDQGSALPLGKSWIDAAQKEHLHQLSWWRCLSYQGNRRAGDVSLPPDISWSGR